jgi:Domain of unknown function (DUF4907)
MINMKSTFSTGIVIALCLVMHGCNSYRSGKLPDKPRKKGDIIAQTFKTGDGWGYTVFVNDKLFIKQSFIPVLEGNRGFTKEDDAIKVANLVVNKLKHHQQPTIRLDELQQFGLADK